MPGGPTLSKLVSKPVPASETWGKLTALDLANGGRVLWQVKTPEPLVGGTLATAGGLVFTGEANGHFSAYDAANVGAPPMSYAVNGRQFVAVATGTAAGPGGPRPGGAIMAFALPGQVVADGPAEDGGGRLGRRDVADGLADDRDELTAAGDGTENARPSGNR